jgi:DNA polymerase-1
VTDLDTPPWDTGTPSFTAASLAKLKHSGLDAEYALSKRVVPVTSVDDLGTEFTWSQYLCPVPGMLFHWEHPTTGELVPQYRPDNPVTYPDGEPGPKYMFPEGQHQGLGLIKKSDVPNDRIAIVEGTLQGLVFARYAPADVTVYAIAGCWGWSQGTGETHTPTPALSVVDGKPVSLFVDADAGTNPDVWDGITELARAVVTYGASEVAFGRVPVRGTNGVDDFLGSVDEGKRAGVVEKLMVQVAQKPADRKPQAKRKKLGGDPLSQDMPPTDDTFLGTTWADQHLNEFRVISTDKAWISYRDGRWSVDGAELSVGHSMLEFMSEASQPLQAAAARTKAGDPEEHEKFRRAVDAILSTRKRQAVQSSAMVYRPIHVLRDRLDQHPRKFCVANGVLDLDTGEVLPHDPELLLTTGSDVVYDPAATCPRFDEFLAEVQPDDEVRGYLMRIFAMGLFGEVREHILPVLLGEGRNGKGTTIRIMHEVYGSHADVAEASTILVRKFDKHEQEVARLAGKRLITIEETTQGAVWNVGRINSWTGGDRLTGRWMGGNNFSFRPSHTLIVATNHQPSVGQGERAFWARYREIPFNVSFEGREDGTLEPHIVANELSGVLNRLIEAGRDYMVNGLREPSAVTMATLGTKVDADNLARFCAEHVAVTHDHELDRVVNADFYEAMHKWWTQNVRGEVLPSTRAFAKLARHALGFPSDMDNPRKLRDEGKVKLSWTGIRWLNGGAPEDQLLPLPQTGNTIMNIGNTWAPNPSPMGQGVEDQTPGVADVGVGVAGSVADVVDQEADVIPAPSASVADVADVASKVRRNSVSEGTAPEAPVDQEICASPSVRESDNGAKRQQRQHVDLQGDFGALGDMIVIDLETDSAGDLYTASDASRYVRLAGASSALPDAVTPVLSTNSSMATQAVKSSRLVVGHNLVHFDLPALSRIDPEIDILAMTRNRRVFDTMIADSVLNPIQNESRPGEVGRAMKHFGLDVSAERHGVPGKTHDLKKHVKQYYEGDFNAIEWETDEELQNYCIGDVAATHAIYRQLTYSHAHPALPEPTREYVWREHRVHAIAAVMGMNGFLVDEPELRKRYEAGVKRKQELTATLVREYDIPTVKADGKPSKSPAATKEGKTALEAAFRSLGVDPDVDITRTAKGSISFGGDAMRELSEKFAGHDNAEKIAALCEVVADSAGIRTVYGTALEHMKRHPDGTYKVHPQVATFQASGRWSVTKPGLTVFGKRGGKVIERAVFTAAPGNVLMAIDLSQVDARAVAGHCQDPAYMALFEPGRDSHMDVAEMVWGIRDAEHRHMAKAIGHGWNYGMGIQKIVTQAGVPEETARQFNEAMKQKFPRLVAWKDEVRALAEQPGAYLDNGFGRLMRPNPERAYNQGPALYGQGTARDIMMDCLLKIDDFDAQHGTRIIHMLRAQVHDEAVFEIPEAKAGSYKTVIEHCFTGEFRGVPIIAEGGCFGRSWADCYEKE